MCDTIMMTNKFEMKEIKQWHFEYTYEIWGGGERGGQGP